MFPLRDSQPSHKFPLITILIILACAYVLFLEITAVDPEAFIYKWGLVPALIGVGGLESLKTFVTSMFLHGGFVHFISNMWFLWIYGDNVEAALGKIGFVLFYLLSGIAASLLQFVFSFGSGIPMLGASGAIAGVLGFYFVNFRNSRIETLVMYPFFTIVELPSSFVLALWFLSQVFSGTASFLDTSGGGVAWWAHIGGFAFGYFVGKF